MSSVAVRTVGEPGFALFEGRDLGHTASPAALYTPRPGALADQLGLIEAAPATANVVLATPQDPSIIVPRAGGPGLASAALVIADLQTLPNRRKIDRDLAAALDRGWLL